MSTNAEIVKTLKALVKSTDQLKIAIEKLVDASDSKSDEQFKILNAKLDLFKNLDLESRENIADKKSANRKPNKPTFFKRIFKENRDEYLNNLYTQEEIDVISALDEVQKKKNDDDKNTKIAALIWEKHIKANQPEGRTSAFESIFSQFYPWFIQAIWVNLFFGSNG